jgi:hypothetical protein
MPKVNAKSKRSQAERAAEHYAHDIGCVLTRRAIQTKYHKVDFFGADIMGFKANGEKIFIQATAGQYSAVTARRRKLEAIPWHNTDTVLICQLIQSQDPANARKKLWFFRIHKYQFYHHVHNVGSNVRVWETSDKAVEIPREWFKAWPPAVKPGD